MLSPLLDAIDAVARRDPDRLALVDAAERRTYGELAASLAGAAAPSEPQRIVLAARPAVAEAELILLTAAREASALVLDAQATVWETRRAAGVFTAEPLPEAPLIGLCTSGTSGLPRVVELDWAGVLRNAAAFGEAAGYDADVIWVTTPLAHLYGLGAGLIAGLLRGCTVLLASGAIGPAEFGEQLLGARVSVLLSVPFLLRRYLAELERDPQLAPASRLRIALAAGEPVGDELVAAWRRASGRPLLSHYGLTEGGHVTLAGGDPDDGTGRPVPAIEVRVERDGHVCVRHVPPAPPYRVIGEPPPPGGWRRTGDRGFLDERGALHIVGRASERLNVAGRKVDPAEVEQTIVAHPAVRDCAVAGVPDAGCGQRIVAFVEAEQDLGAAALRAHVLATLSPYKLPARFVAVEAIPRTMSGKIRRGELLALLAPDRVSGDAVAPLGSA